MPEGLEPAGLVQQAQAAPTDVVGAAPVANEEVDQEDNLTPEERESYDAAMNMVSEILYANDESSAAIMEQLGASEPLRAIAEVTSFLIAQIEEAFQGQLPETLIIPVADEASDLVIELGEKAGIFDLSDDEIIQAKGAVMTSLLEDYGIDEADLEEMMQGVTSEDVTQLQSVFGGQ